MYFANRLLLEVERRVCEQDAALGAVGAVAVVVVGAAGVVVVVVVGAAVGPDGNPRRREARNRLRRT